MTLRAGILGCGGIALRHADAIAATPGVVLVGACSRDLAKAHAFATPRGAKGFSNLDAMIDAGLDLLVITTPPYARAGEAEHAAARGTHLLVEKPIALDIAAAQRMTAAVAASGVVAAIGFMYRHGEAVQAWQRADTGPVGMMTGAFHCNHLHAPWWRIEAESGGQILEQLLHIIDLVRLFMGEPDSVVARRARVFHAEAGYDVEDVSAIIFSWDDGRIATINANNVAVSGLWHKEWALFAREMTGRFNSWNDAEFRRSDGSGAPRTIAGTRSPFDAQIADVAAAIIEGRQPLVPLAEGERTLRIALAARAAADEGGEIRLTS